MEPQLILFSNNLDLLFENRNKLYGAYPLRKYYKQRLLTAMGIVFGIVFLLASLLVIFRNQPDFSSLPLALPEVVLTTVDLGVPTIKKSLTLRLPAARKRVAVAPLTAPLIVHTQRIDKAPASIAEMKFANIGISTVEGPAANGDMTGQPGIGAGAGKVAKDSADNVPGPLKRAEVMPEFPGGPEALRRYLAKSLRMPDTRAEAGSQVRVVVEFIVGTDGKVTGINAIQSGGGPYDREVERVISRMPAWKPGMQNGRKVSVYYMLPVSFIIPAGD
jgi:protein TonB